MVDLIKNLPDTTYIVFVESEVDKRSKLYKAVTAKGMQHFAKCKMKPC